MADTAAPALSDCRRVEGRDALPRRNGPRTLPDVYPVRTTPTRGYQDLGVAELMTEYAPGRIPIDT
jgi:hypothetical protein